MPPPATPLLIRRRHVYDAARYFDACRRHDITRLLRDIDAGFSMPRHG